MPGFYSLQGVFDFMQHKVMYMLYDITEEMAQLVKKELMNNWYNRSWYNADATAYERTYQLLKAISVRQLTRQPSTGLYEYEIYYDEERIIAMDGTSDKPLPRHKSLVNGEDFISGLTQVMEYGNPSPIYGWSEGNAPKPFTTVELFLRAYLKEYVMKVMRQNGFTVTDSPGMYNVGR